MAKKAASTGKASKASSRAPAKRAGRALGEPIEVAPAPSPIEIPRPGPLSAVIGQDRAIATLASAFRSGRLHHAWIFHGPPGVGKMTTALAFAAAALDPDTKIGRDGVPAPDPGSEVQRLLARGAHPDLHVVVKELARFHEDASVRTKKLATIPKEIIERHVIEPMQLAPTIREHGLAGKVFIVDEAEIMDRSLSHAPVQNALLKTLEEPPEGALLILVTSSEERLLPTIRSRCQRVSFSPLSEQQMAAWLRTRPDVQAEPEDRAWLLAYAEGSPGEFLRAAERGIASWRTSLEPLIRRAIQGEFVLELGKVMHDLGEGWAKEEVDRNANASKETANRVGARLVLRIVCDRLRRELRERVAKGRDPEPVMDALEAVREAEGFIASNVSGLFVMEGVASGVASAMAGRAISPGA